MGVYVQLHVSADRSRRVLSATFRIMRDNSNLTLAGCIMNLPMCSSDEIRT